MSSEHHRPETFIASPPMPALTAPLSPQSPLTMNPQLNTETSEKPDSRSPVVKKPRGTSAGNGDEPQKITKRRAARACTTCRARKVRCNVTETMPCSNCNWDKTLCSLSESRRRKKHVPPIGAPYIPRPQSHPPLASAPGGQFLPNAMPMTTGFGLSGQLSLPQQQHAFGNNFMTSPAAPLQPPVSAAGFPTPPRPLDLPDFISPPNNFRIPAEDLDFMQRKGCFDLPPEQLRRKLLRAYIEHIHPVMPVIDLHWFLDVMLGQDQGGAKISLLLFQAVMFAAATFVSLQDVRDAGYSTRSHARQVLFHRAKYLEALAYEQDKHVLVQSLLLMSFWYSTPSETRDTWHYTGLALSTARTLNLHRDPTSRGVSPDQARLERRLWWSCVARDRLIALGMRRPTRVSDGDHTTPKPTEADFQYRAVDNYPQIGEDCDVIGDVVLQQRLALNFIELVNLSELIFAMLTSQYSTLCHTGPHMVGPRDGLDPEHQAEVLKVDAKLQQWFSGLKDWQVFQPSPFPYQGASRTELVMATHRILLNMLGQTTKGALWRPFFALELRSVTQGDLAGTDTLLQQVQRKAKEVVPDVAVKVTQMTQELKERGLVGLLPTFAVTAILPTLFVHMLRVRDLDKNVRENAIRGYQIIKTVLMELSEVYSAALFGLQVANQLCANTGVTVPDLPPTPVAVHPLATMNHDSSMTPPPDNSGMNLGNINLSQMPMYGYQAPVSESTPPSSGEDTPMWGQPDVGMNEGYSNWAAEPGQDAGIDTMLDQFIQFEPGGEGLGSCFMDQGHSMEGIL